MGIDSIFSFQLTFTHGLVIGQLSILFLFATVFKYLFLDTSEAVVDNSTSFQPRLEFRAPPAPAQGKTIDPEDVPESIEWLNVALLHVRLPTRP